MKIHLATDHAGYDLKESLKKYLEGEGYDIIDHGATSYDPDDDYPDFVIPAALAVNTDPENNRAIIFGGSGQGEAMAANKYKHARAFTFYGGELPVESLDIDGATTNDPLELVALGRLHNDANILSIGARFVGETEAQKAVKVFLDTPFLGEERHTRRIMKVIGEVA